MKNARKFYFTYSNRISETAFSLFEKESPFTLPWTHYLQLMRIIFNEDNYYVDVVFYNRLLRCCVLIDLKIDKLTHQDLGQMLMYVHYYDIYEKLQ